VSFEHQRGTRGEPCYDFQATIAVRPYRHWTFTHMPAGRSFSQSCVAANRHYTTCGSLLRGNSVWLTVAHSQDVTDLHQKGTTHAKGSRRRPNGE
jgi:hypothetical protein